MDDREITITQALNQIQSWLNAGEFDKVTQGCKEILELEPSNQRALALMKQAEEKKFGVPTITPVSAVPSADPLIAHLQQTPEAPQASHPLAAALMHMLALIVPAVLVVLIGGGLIWYLSNRQTNEVIKDLTTATENSGDYLAQNEKRVEDLTKMGQVLEKYKSEKGAYPSVGQVEQVLKTALGEVPLDPRQGDVDKSGKPYGYIYAVYDSNKDYIVSAIFEDSKGYAYPWSRGASVSLYPDYRDLSKNNVHAITGDGKSDVTEDESPKPKVKVKR
ncbi:hypothetical protein HY463_01315 [Candidatus Peregrinibacteria bacterium]|nr:hypothetical protein [Candidatus Peregrinibacteria bacterium]